MGLMGIHVPHGPNTPTVNKLKSTSLLRMKYEMNVVELSFIHA
jgi:hypothetical protein